MGVKRDFLETERSPGWVEYKRRLEELIEIEHNNLKSLDTDNKTAEQIGVEHIKIKARIDGLNSALAISEEIKKEPDEDI